MRTMRILVVMGTRPEVIKLAPLVRRLRREKGLRVRLCVTAQHRELLDGMLKDFDLRPDIDLDLMRPGQALNAFLAQALRELPAVFKKERPDLVLAQGDTATVLAAALSAFDGKIAFGHVEAGLRSFDKWLPYPEEKIRVMTDHVSDLLFAPTASAKANLLREGLDAKSIFVTGNTAVDALLEVAARPHAFREPRLAALPAAARLAVVTLHRRESFGAPLEGVFRGLLKACRSFPELTWAYPVHPNPRVRAAAHRILRHPRIMLLPPLGYFDFVHLMKRCEVIITDSGGIQEEAPSLGKPVLVIRDKTERTEALGQGATLVGLSSQKLLRELGKCLRRGPAARRPARNPFGDGRASERITAAILHWAGRTARRPKDF